MKETVVEIQQLEISKLNAKLDGHVETEHDKEVPKLSLLELKQQEEAKLQQVQTILQRVVDKHVHQMEKGTFYSSIKPTEGMEPSTRPARARRPQPNKKVKDPDSSLLERRQSSDARSAEEWFSRICHAMFLRYSHNSHPSIYDSQSGTNREVLM